MVEQLFEAVQLLTKVVESQQKAIEAHQHVLEYLVNKRP